VFEPPQHVAIQDVGTDTDRLDALSDDFQSAINRSPLNDVLRLNPTYRKGYFAPRLEGIWARFPYLHNASIPSLAALLTTPDQRPRVFDLHDAGEAYRYDQQTAGLTVPTSGSPAEQRLSRRARDGARDVYDVTRMGQSNRGHAFGTALDAEQKRALIEYLKTL
jgi:hypothetical protein